MGQRLLAPLRTGPHTYPLPTLETIYYLLHGQAASDWVNREPGQWIKDVYVKLESLGKLSPKDVVET